MRSFRTLKSAVDQIMVICGGDETLEDSTLQHWMTSHGEDQVSCCYEKAVKHLRTVGYFKSGFNSSPEKIQQHSEVF